MGGRSPKFPYVEAPGCNKRCKNPQTNVNHYWITCWYSKGYYYVPRLLISCLQQPPECCLNTVISWRKTAAVTAVWLCEWYRLVLVTRVRVNIGRARQQTVGLADQNRECLWKFVHMHKRITALCPDYTGGPVPEETFTHSQPSWLSNMVYQLAPPTVIHSILLVQFTCLTILFHNLSPSPVLFLFVWDPLLHTLYISSPNYYLPFATHAHTMQQSFRLAL